MRTLYTQHILATNTPGSNKASSYISALNYLGPILSKYSRQFSTVSTVWKIQSPRLVQELYDYVLQEQKKGGDGIFKEKERTSYWRNNYYSAALKSYKEFLLQHLYEEKLWKIFEETPSGTDLSKRLTQAPLRGGQELVNSLEIDTSKSGKDVLREVKTRVNQMFFRKMILKVYNQQCCLTGLNVPEVLRASHIIPWSADKENRMNPENGLCLTATYDAAFDRHLISFDEDYRMILSPSLKDYVTNTAFKQQFKAFEGKTILRPSRYFPSQKLLEKHRHSCLVGRGEV